MDGMETSILGPALLAGLLVLSTHVPMGREVLRRGIIFIDIAVAQLAGTGVIAAQVLGWHGQWWHVQAAGLGAALAGAAFLTWSERRWPQLQEAIIGVIFVTMASLAILLLAGHPHGGEELTSLLAGQILWVTPEMLRATSILYLPLLLAWFALPGPWRARLFYILFTLAVTTSVQLVGVYLVFASLVLPALAAYGLRDARALPIAYGVGIGGYALGLMAAARFDLPAGSMVVMGLLASSLFAAGVHYALGRARARRSATV